MGILEIVQTRVLNIMDLGEDRMAICTKCEHFKAKTLVMNYSLCGQCGCVLEAKTLIPRANCPIHKWDGL